MSNSNVSPEVQKLLNEIAALKAANAAQATAMAAKVSLKVSEKGAVSLYGMGRFPVTLYASQWLTVLDMADKVRGFIKENEAKLAVKGQARAAA